MTYKLLFKEQALEEWNNLDQTIREQFIIILTSIDIGPLLLRDPPLTRKKNVCKLKPELG